MALISCPDCGRKVSDRAVSCPECGCPIAADFGVSAAPIAPAKNPQLEQVDREIILAHLADLRALELSKYSIEQKLVKYAARYNLSRPENMSQLQQALLNRVFDCLMAMTDTEYYYMTPLQISSRLRQQGLTLPLIYVEENGKRESLINYLASHQAAPDNIVELVIDELNKSIPGGGTIDSDRIRVKMALQKAYEPNLIPAPYRDVYPIYYLYDYLSTSRESLSDALLHLDLDLIRQRLDTVIATQCVSIVQQAITNAQLAFIQSRFDTLIETAKSIEQNTAAIARYSQISAAHLETIKYLNFLRP